MKRIKQLPGFPPDFFEPISNPRRNRAKSISVPRIKNSRLNQNRNPIIEDIQAIQDYNYHDKIQSVPFQHQIQSVPFQHQIQSNPFQHQIQNNPFQHQIQNNPYQNQIPNNRCIHKVPSGIHLAPLSPDIKGKFRPIQSRARMYPLKSVPSNIKIHSPLLKQ